jgi:hypothetical protein
MTGRPTSIRSGHSLTGDSTPELPAVEQQPIRGDVKRTQTPQRSSAPAEATKSESSSFFGRFWSRPKPPAFLKPAGRGGDRGGAQASGGGFDCREGRQQRSLIRREVRCFLATHAA